MTVEETGSEVVVFIHVAGPWKCEATWPQDQGFVMIGSGTTPLELMETFSLDRTAAYNNLPAVQGADACPEILVAITTAGN